MANPNVINLTESNFSDEVTNASMPVLVDFWAPWCGPCLQLSPVIDEIANETVGKAKIAKVNVDEQPGLAGKFRVNSLPTLLFFKGGQPVGQAGSRRKADLLQQLGSLA